MDDPSARQARVLEDLDRQIEQAESERAWINVGAPAELWTVWDSIIPGLVGRRNILQRHAPCAGCERAYGHTYPSCHTCERQAPCPDWLDAAAGLEEETQCLIRCGASVRGCWRSRWPSTPSWTRTGHLPGWKAPVDDLDATLRAAAPPVLRWYAERMRQLAETQPDDRPAAWPWTGYLLAAGAAERAAREVEALSADGGGGGGRDSNP